MAKNPHLGVFVANGYYDLATPFAATRYTFSRLPLEGELKNHVTMTYYAGGHMMYIDRAAHRKLRDDVLAFLRTAIPAR